MAGLDQFLQAEAVPFQLALADFPTDLQGFFPFFLVEPLADPAFGPGGFDQPEPGAVRFLLGRGEDLDQIAVLELGFELGDDAVDLGAGAAISHLGMDAVGKVDGGAALGKFLYLPVGGQHEDLFFVELALDRIQKLPGVFHFLEGGDQLLEPFEKPGVL